MADHEIDLKLGGDSLYHPIPDKNVNTALATLRRIGRGDIAVALEDGSTVTVRLHADADVITGLYGVGTSLSLWKVIRDKNGLLYADNTLAPPMARRNVVTPIAVAYAVDKDTQRRDGHELRG